MTDFPERDWQTLRALKPDLLNRLCSRILDECRAAIDGDAASTPHERYLQLFSILRDRNDDIAAGFDDMRRSRAIERLMQMYRLDLFEPGELERFTPETRERIVISAELRRELQARRRS